LGHGLLGPGRQPGPVPGGCEARSRDHRRGVRQVHGSPRTTASWTTRGWAIGAVADAPLGFRFGLLVAYLKDGSRTRFPAGEVGYLAGDVFAKGTIGPAKLQAEFYYGGGTVDRDALGDLDLGGLGGYAGVYLPVGSSVSIGLEGAYSRGDDPKTSGRNEGVFSADYEGPYWSVIFYNNMDYSGYGGDSQSSGYGTDFGVRNAVTGKFSAVFTPLRNLSVTGAVLYAAADQTRDAFDRRWVGSSM
jgi:hypothetical protein